MTSFVFKRLESFWLLKPDYLNVGLNSLKYGLAKDPSVKNLVIKILIFVSLYIYLSILLAHKSCLRIISLQCLDTGRKDALSIVYTKRLLQTYRDSRGEHFWLTPGRQEGIQHPFRKLRPQKIKNRQNTFIIVRNASNVQLEKYFAKRREDPKRRTPQRQ